jgi:hypothetical protein
MSTDDPFRCICDPDELFEAHDPRPLAVEGCPAHQARRAAQLFAATHLCRARTGVIWKLGGEVCSCVRRSGHPEVHHPAGEWHVCSCGAWYVDSVVRWRPVA